MTSQDFNKRLVTYIDDNYGSNASSEGIELPPQGMSSSVFFIKLLNGTDCAVKYGKNAMKDVSALELIKKKKLNIPVPKLIGYFIFKSTS